MKRVYLDHNATCPVHPEVLEAMLPYLRENFGNPSSLHSFGKRARKGVEEAREKLAKLIGCLPEEIIFLSGGTEANNLAIKGVAEALKSKGNHIITSKVEHHAILNPCKRLESLGYEVTYLEVDRWGRVDPEEVRKSIRSTTILITIIYANNETGTIEPIARISEIAREKGVYFHTDAVQAVGKIPCQVEKLGVDMLSLSGHKIYGPKGIGALYIKKGIKIHSLLQGGHHEKNLRAGTENVPGIVGLGKAAEIALRDREKERGWLLNLRERLERRLKEEIESIHIHGHPTERLPNTLNVSFEGVEGESIILNLDLKGIAVSSGSACTSGSLEPSHVLSAMRVPAPIAQGSVRFSLGRGNTQEDIDYTVEVLKEIIERLRELSPLYRRKRKNEKK